MLTVDFSRLDLSPGSRVLDAGCGTGRHLTEAFRSMGVNVVGIDMKRQDATKARNMLNQMRLENESGGGSANVMISDITRLPFQDESFDIVICSEVLEHIPDHHKAVQEIVRVLKPGKSLVVSVPRFLPEKICWALSEDYRTEEGGHVRIFKKQELIDILESAGTKCIGNSWAHALHSPYWWIKCLVGHKNENSLVVKIYHKFLVWDIMNKPFFTRSLEKILNPFIAKSIVLYLKKGDYDGT
ncbi:MAG: class I SAM-dependent methyltransferase [Deltaproteobacteria bacterium]|nr:class I SAM-dependent methyltransferase [Deltaproteobacteria bacterium]